MSAAREPRHRPGCAALLAWDVPGACDCRGNAPPNAPAPRPVGGVAEGHEVPVITDATLAAWERVCAAATPGPWEMVDYNRERPEADTWLGVIRGAFEIATPRHEIGHVQYSALPHAENVANATLIALSRTALPALLREVRALREDAARLDWWERHMHDGPCVGLYTDGVIGLGRGHVVDSKWTVRGKPYLTLRAAIDAALTPPARAPGGEVGDG